MGGAARSATVAAISVRTQANASQESDPDHDQENSDSRIENEVPSLRPRKAKMRRKKKPARRSASKKKGSRGGPGSKEPLPYERVNRPPLTTRNTTKRVKISQSTADNSKKTALLIAQTARILSHSPYIKPAMRPTEHAMRPRAKSCFDFTPPPGTVQRNSVLPM